MSKSNFYVLVEGVAALSCCHAGSLDHSGSCDRPGRVFWILQLKAVKQFYDLSNVLEAMLLCVPLACLEEAAAGFLAPLYLFQGLRSGVLDLPEDLLQPGCHENHIRMPFRLAVAADQLAEFREGLLLGPEAARDLRRSWLIHFGQDPREKRPPVIFTATEQPLLPHTMRESAQTYQAKLCSGANASGSAVLFAGDWRFDEAVIRSIHRHLVRPLAAKVFAVVSRRGQRHGWKERHTLKKHLPSLRAFVWLLDDSDADLRLKIPPHALRFYERLGGRALAPLARHSKGGSLHSLIKLQKVLELTEAYERQRGYCFRWLVYSRLDLLWIASHPPLRLLDERSIWTVPLGGTLQEQTRESIAAACRAGHCLQQSGRAD